MSAPRKLLIVSPRFPPTNAADVHRVRTSLAHYRSFGWEATVLAVDAATAEGGDDRLLAEALPPEIRVVRVQAWSEAKCRRFGFGQLAYRSLLPLYRAGCRLLKRERHDLILFSTTVFLCFALGPLWKRRFGCAIVYDFHDPWYCGSRQVPQASVPGNLMKYRVDQLLAKYLEKFALRSAAHLFSVSAFYVKALVERYPWLGADKFTVLPFGAAASDYAFARERGVKHNVFPPGGPSRHWVSAGAIVPAMYPVLAEFLASLGRLRLENPVATACLRLNFVGSDYAASDRAYKRVEPIAGAYGVGDLIEEDARRIPYFEAIALYQASDAILLIGSTEADYTASKLMTCVLSKKPILALFNRGSLVAEIAAQFPNVFLATFSETPTEPAFRVQVANGIEWLLAPDFDPASIDALVKPWSAEELTRRQCAIFDRVSAPAARSVPSPMAVSRAR
ncbi:MAG TPA: glycosyltransferase [Stellaceae bacterium]|nr:glycosyltransferase [Stellaceae bacterium]